MPRFLYWLAAIAIVSCIAVDTAAAQTKRTEHTYKLGDAEQPAATLQDVAWFVGSWTGTAFEGSFEEVWNPPSAGSMVGFFKLMKDDAVEFYELLLLVEEAGSLSLKVKHFNADFSAWEEKADYVNFRLVFIEENAVHFSGISFYRMSNDEIHAYLVLRNDKDVWEEKLVYRRVH